MSDRARPGRLTTMDGDLQVDRGLSSDPIHKGWHSRGYLPHFDERNLIQSITFRLGDSVPLHVRDRLHQVDEHTRFLQTENTLDTGYGECWLSQPAIAALVQGTFLHFDGTRYHLLGWVIMPNHVHCVIEQIQDWSLGKVIGGWKGYTSHEANKLLNRNGRFWAEEYYDRYVRDGTHLHNVIQYIHHNPVRAGLAKAPEDWLWSSAHPSFRAPGPGAVRHFEAEASE